MVATAAENTNVIVHGGGSCIRYFGTPHAKSSGGGNSGNIQFAVQGLPQCLIDIIIHSFLEGRNDFRYFAKAPLAEVLDDELNIDRILRVCKKHRSKKFSWEPDFDSVERLMHVLVPLCERYFHRTEEVVEKLTKLVDLSAENWYYRTRALLSVMRGLKYCPTSFIATLEQLAKHQDFAIAIAALHTLEKVGFVGREALERLCGVEVSPHQHAICLHAATDLHFDNEDVQDIVARKSKEARWDGHCYDCTRDFQFEMAQHGVHAWRHLLASFEFNEDPERPHDVAGVPYALAIIGNLPQLIELHATSPQRKIAILQAISMTAAKFKFRFDKDCKYCKKFVPQDDVSNLFAWTLLMVRDPANEVAQQAANTLDLLLAHPSIKEEHRKAALSRVQDGRKMADPNLQASRAMLIGSLIPNVGREELQKSMHTVLCSIMYSLELRYHIALAIKGVENPFCHKLECMPGGYPQHSRPNGLESSLVELAEAYGNRALSDFEATLYQDLLAMHLDTSERERRAMKILHG